MGLNFKDTFGKADVSINCPKCNYKFSIKLNQIGTTVSCPGCRRSIQLNSSSQTNNSVKNIDKSFKDLEKTLKNFGK